MRHGGVEVMSLLTRNGAHPAQRGQYGGDRRTHSRMHGRAHVGASLPLLLPVPVARPHERAPQPASPRRPLRHAPLGGDTPPEGVEPLCRDIGAARRRRLEDQPYEPVDAPAGRRDA